jgi:excisionase family DNA binding protein
MMRKKEPEEKVLDVNASMQGTLVFNDPVNLRINGKFQGKLKTQGQLTIGKDADVEATIEGETILILGRVKGNVRANNKLALLATAVLYGDISVANLSMEEGAIFEGSCKMLTEKMSVDEVSKYLDIEVGKIMEWVKEGRIPTEKDNEKLSFDRRKIDVWLTQGR